jgi:DNA-binding NtrC family response regulator
VPAADGTYSGCLVPRGHLLIVEDDRGVRDSLVDVLNEEGYEASVASDGAEALALLKHLPRPCLIVLDLLMPVLDGEGFLRVLDARPDREDFVVAVMSANLPVERYVGRRGILRVLKKPFDMDEILRLAEEHCVPKEAMTGEAESSDREAPKLRLVPRNASDTSPSDGA